MEKSKGEKVIIRERRFYDSSPVEIRSCDRRSAIFFTDNRSTVAFSFDIRPDPTFLIVCTRLLVKGIPMSIGRKKREKEYIYIYEESEKVWERGGRAS